MPGAKEGPAGGRHARPDPVGRRGLLKASLVLAAVAVPGSAVLADHLLTERSGAGRAAPGALPVTTPRSAAPSVPRPSRAAGPLAGKVVVIDPGHNPNNIRHLAQIDRLTDAGGFLKACNTIGTETDAGYPEYDFTLDVARRTRVILRAAGARVVLTQNGHTPYGPCNDQRAWLGNRLHADASVAIHADGGPAGGHGFAALVPELVVKPQADNSMIIKPSAELGEHRRAAFHLSRREWHPAPQ